MTPKSVKVALRQLVLTATLVGLVFAGPAQARPDSARGMEGPTPSLADPADVQAFLDEFVPGQMRELGVPGLAFVLVADGQVALARGYGYADVERQLPFDPERTIVRAGSIVKTVTALAVMQLAEQGRLDLDADVNRYLTTFQIPATYPEPVTARQLLHFTGGFDSRFVGIRVMSASEIPPLREYLADNLPPRVRPSGVLRAYNDHEIALAGLLVEEVSGLSYADYVRLNIFEPLGMGSTSMVVPEGQLDRVAIGYASDGPYPPDHYFLQDAPGAGFNTTPADLGRYMRMHLGGGELEGRRLLSPAAMDELHTTRFRHHPLLPGIAYTFDETFHGDIRMLAKGGGAPGFMNRMLLLPDQGIGIYFVYNRDSSVPLARRLEDALLDRFLPLDEAGHPEKPSTDVDLDLNRYVGAYVSLNDNSERSLEKMQQLMDQAQVTQDGQGGLRVLGGRIVPVAMDLFRWDDGDGYVAFRADDRGRVTHLFAGRTAFARVPWYETFPLQVGLFGFAITGFVFGLAGWLISEFRRAGRTRVLSGVISLLNLGFVLGLAVLMAPVFADSAPPWALSFAPSPALLFLLAIPLVAAGLTVALLQQVLTMWLQARAPRWPRVQASLVLLASAAFLFFLHTWNLLGYRF